MPAKQRRRSDDKRGPACLRQQTHGSEEESIVRAQLGSSELATQHQKLVAQHDDFDDPTDENRTDDVEPS